MGARQMLGLPLKPDMVFARVWWNKQIPEQRLSEHAVRPGGQKKMWTSLVRLYPEDLGLVSEDVQPEDVFHLALQWGFNLISREVATALLLSSFGGEKQIGGLVAFADFDQKITQVNLEIVNRTREWLVSPVPAPAGLRRRPGLIAQEDWSILVASETSEEARR